MSSDAPSLADGTIQCDAKDDSPSVNLPSSDKQSEGGEVVEEQDTAKTKLLVYWRVPV